MAVTRSMAARGATTPPVNPARAPTQNKKHNKKTTGPRTTSNGKSQTTGPRKTTSGKSNKKVQVYLVSNGKLKSRWETPEATPDVSMEEEEDMETTKDGSTLDSSAFLSTTMNSSHTRMNETEKHDDEDEATVETDDGEDAGAQVSNNHANRLADAPLFYYIGEGRRLLMPPPMPSPESLSFCLSNVMLADNYKPHPNDLVNNLQMMGLDVDIKDIQLLNNSHFKLYTSNEMFFLEFIAINRHVHQQLVLHMNNPENMEIQERSNIESFGINPCKHLSLHHGWSKDRNAVVSLLTAATLHLFQKGLRARHDGRTLDVMSRNGTIRNYSAQQIVTDPMYDCVQKLMTKTGRRLLHKLTSKSSSAPAPREQ